MDKATGRVKARRANPRRMAGRNEERERRLAEALRANLRKRKASVRGDGRPVEQAAVSVIAPGGGVEE